MAVPAQHSLKLPPMNEAGGANYWRGAGRYERGDRMTRLQRAFWDRLTQLPN